MIFENNITKEINNANDTYINANIIKISGNLILFCSSTDGEEYVQRSNELFIILFFLFS
jgi:hypothetical protein